jgi:hypothetical protein
MLKAVEYSQSPVGSRYQYRIVYLKSQLERRAIFERKLTEWECRGRCKGEFDDGYSGLGQWLDLKVGLLFLSATSPDGGSTVAYPF